MSCAAQPTPLAAAAPADQRQRTGDRPCGDRARGPEPSGALAAEAWLGGGARSVLREFFRRRPGVSGIVAAPQADGTGGGDAGRGRHARAGRHRRAHARSHRMMNAAAITRTIARVFVRRPSRRRPISSSRRQPTTSRRARACRPAPARRRSRASGAQPGRFRRPRRVYSACPFREAKGRQSGQLSGGETVANSEVCWRGSMPGEINVEPGREPTASMSSGWRGASKDATRRSNWCGIIAVLSRRSVQPRPRAICLRASPRKPTCAASNFRNPKLHVIRCCSALIRI